MGRIAGSIEFDALLPSAARYLPVNGFRLLGAGDLLLLGFFAVLIFGFFLPTVLLLLVASGRYDFDEVSIFLELALSSARIVEELKE